MKLSDQQKELEKRLGDGQRLTAQRKTILAALSRHGATITAQELFEELRLDHPSIGRATVFRNLDALVEIGLARRFERAGHLYAYAACSPAHHHHLLCSSCNRATEIDESLVAQLLRDLDDKYGFAVEHEALDFYGICAKCRKAARAT